MARDGLFIQPLLLPRVGALVCRSHTIRRPRRMPVPNEAEELPALGCELTYFPIDVDDDILILERESPADSRPVDE